MSSTFPERLRAARELRGLNQTQLAEKTGLPPSAINHFEQDRRAPSFDNLKRLANALEVTTDYLLGRSDDPSLCGPTADQMFRDAKNLTAEDLKMISMLMDTMAKKNQAAERGKHHGKEDAR